MNVIKQIDSCDCLFLVDISEPEANSLRLVLEEARASGPEQTLQVGDGTLEGVRRIEHGEECRVFELYWASYIAYSVLNESFVKREDNAEFEGRLFRCYSRSAYLDYLRLTSTANEQWPGPFKHYGLGCSDHIVDIASLSEPEIKLLKPGRPFGVNGI